MSDSGAPSDAVPVDARTRHRDLLSRQIGSVGPSSFRHRVGGGEDLIQRLRLYGKLSGHYECVNTLHFNPSGDTLLSGSDDKEIIFWDWMAKRKRFSYFSGHTGNVFQARVMPFTEDRSVVSSGADGQVRHGLVLEGGRVETKNLAKHQGAAHKLAVEPGSSHTFFSCGEDGTVLHFDLRQPSYTKLVTCLGYNGRYKSRFASIHLNSISLNPRNPNYFAVGGSDEYARIYDVRSLDPLDDNPTSYYTPKHLVGFSYIHITSLAYSLQEELLVSYNDELIYLFEKGMEFQELRSDDSDDSEEDDEDKEMKDPDDEPAAADHNAPQVYKGHRNAETVKGVNFMGPNMEYVVSGSDCGHIFIWKKRGGELLAMLKGDKGAVNCLEPHPHATFLATSGLQKTVKIWAPSSKNLQPFPKNAEKIMERNRRRREESLHITPDIIMRVFRMHSYSGDLHSQSDGDGRGYTQPNSDDDENDQIGSPRECIIS